MERVDKQRCELPIFRCDTIMKSKCKLPESVYGKFGNSVIKVTNITDTVAIQKVTYDNLISKKSKSRYSDLEKSGPRWFVFGGYLYILDWEILRVNVWLFTLQRDDTCDEIDFCDTGELICPCTDRWDVTFVSSDNLLKFIMDETVARLSPPRTATVDENPDNNSNVVN